MNKLFQIGSFCFRLLCPEGLPLPPAFLLFEITQGVPEYTYELRTADTLPLPDGDVIAERPDLMVCKTPVGENRLIGIKGRETYYACYRETSEKQAEVLLSVHEISDLHIDPVFTSLFALERQMIKRDSLILHCAYMKYHGQAILFSAPSETGKSTQAGLWERYRGSRTVNGDRALLRKIDDRWTACGWPVSGTSGICSPEDTPIQAIVMLSQGKTNQVVRLSPLQAFTQLYSQITINQWNRDFVQHAMEELEELVSQIPIWHLTCDISEDAVRCLETALFPANSKK